MPRIQKRANAAQGWLSFLFLILAAGSPALFGQTGSSTIIGTVTDVQDAVVPNDTVKVTDRATGIVRVATSNEAGPFRALDLKPGRYAVRVEAASFKALEIVAFDLSSAETRDLGRIVLQVGAVTESATLDKQIRLGSEKRSLRFRIEAYNNFNHAEFNQINASLQPQGTSNINTLYGQYTATLPARVLSTTARFQF